MPWTNSTGLAGAPILGSLLAVPTTVPYDGYGVSTVSGGGPDGYAIEPILNYTLIAGGSGTSPGKLYFKRKKTIDWGGGLSTRPDFTKNMNSQGFYWQFFSAQIDEFRGDLDLDWPNGTDNVAFYCNVPMRSRTRNGPLCVGGRRL